MEVLVGRVYKHFKGGYSLVLCVANYCDGKEKLVIYKGLNTGEIYARPFSSFCQMVAGKNGSDVPRFSMVEDKEIEGLLTQQDLNIIKLIKSDI